MLLTRLALGCGCLFLGCGSQASGSSDAPGMGGVASAELVDGEVDVAMQPSEAVNTDVADSMSEADTTQTNIGGLAQNTMDSTTTDTTTDLPVINGGEAMTGEPMAAGGPSVGGAPAPQLSEPIAVSPCGDDLDALPGMVVPNLPAVSGVPRDGRDPSGQGPFAVSRSDHNLIVSDGFDVSMATFVPESAGSGLPLIIALPGRGFTFDSYLHHIEPLASHGFVVVGANVASTDFSSPAEHDLKAQRVLEVLNWALEDSPIAARLNGDRIAAMGHSAGGKLAFYAAALDDRIDMVVAWDPQNGGGPPCSVAQFVGGDCNAFAVAPNCESQDSGMIHQIKAESIVFGAEDALVTPDVHLRADRFYRGAPSPASFISMPTVGHAAWTRDDDVSTLTRGIHTAFLLSRLVGMQDLDEWLPGGRRLLDASDVADVRTK